MVGLGNGCARITLNGKDVDSITLLYSQGFDALFITKMLGGYSLYKKNHEKTCCMLDLST